MAAPTVSITVNAEAYVNSLQSIAKPQLDSIVALALVDTAKSAQSKAASLIAKRTGLKVGTVKPRIFYDHVAPGDYEVAVRSSRKADSPDRVSDHGRSRPVSALAPGASSRSSSTPSSRP